MGIMTVRFNTLLTLLTLALLLSSCADKAYVGEPPTEDAPALTVSQAVDPTTFGRAVRVKGTVHSVCQEEGCWMSITDGTSYLRMVFSEPNILVPMDLSGEVIVEGVVAEEVHDEDVAKAIAGLSFRT